MQGSLASPASAHNQAPPAPELSRCHLAWAARLAIWARQVVQASDGVEEAVEHMRSWLQTPA